MEAGRDSEMMIFMSVRQKSLTLFFYCVILIRRQAKRLDRVDMKKYKSDIAGLARQSLLFDLYGSLLTEKKKTVLELYNEEDMSLSEIAGEFGISRAAVYDSLRSAEKALEEYEEKLGLMRAMLVKEQIAEEIAGIVDGALKRGTDDMTARDLKRIGRLMVEFQGE